MECLYVLGYTVKRSLVIIFESDSLTESLVLCYTYCSQLQLPSIYLRGWFSNSRSLGKVKQLFLRGDAAATRRDEKDNKSTCTSAEVIHCCKYIARFREETLSHSFGVRE